MWVAPKFRSLGIALALLDEVKKWAVMTGSTSLHLGVTLNNGKAYDIYRKYGFKLTGNIEQLQEGSNLWIQPMSFELKTI